MFFSPFLIDHSNTRKIKQSVRLYLIVFEISHAKVRRHKKRKITLKKVNLNLTSFKLSNADVVLTTKYEKYTFGSIRICKKGIVIPNVTVCK